jgi:hypothetical protein
MRRILTNDPVEAPFRLRIASKGPYARSDPLGLAIYTSSVRFVCNGALGFHAAPGTHVANIHKTLLNRRAFFCFHRLITAGTSDDRRAIHSILHNQPHRSC